MSQAMRKICSAAHRSGTAVVFINQIRMRIGVMFGSPETTTGGQALKFYSSCRLDIRRIGAIKRGDEVVGAKTRIKVVKNKLAPPFGHTEVEIHFGEGICPFADLLEMGLAAEFVTKAGSWLRFGNTQLGQGREAARQWLKEHPEEAAQLWASLATGPKESSGAATAEALA